MGNLEPKVEYKGSCFTYVAWLIDMCDIGQQAQQHPSSSLAIRNNVS